MAQGGGYASPRALSNFFCTVPCCDSCCTCRVVKRCHLLHLLCGSLENSYQSSGTDRNFVEINERHKQTNKGIDEREALKFKRSSKRSQKMYYKRIIHLHVLMMLLAYLHQAMYRIYLRFQEHPLRCNRLKAYHIHL